MLERSCSQGKSHYSQFFFPQHLRISFFEGTLILAQTIGGMMTTQQAIQIDEKSVEKAGQGKSTIRFPYLDQDDAVDIAKKIFEVSGNSCEKFALAAKLNVSADGGGFNLRVGTAKMYGFVAGEKGTLTLTDLGLRVIDAQTEKAARAESFLLVPLFKSVYEEYKGQLLPANPALEAAMEKLGVAPKQKDKARQVFQRSATQAGYFAFGNNRLVAPTLKVGTAETPSPPPPPAGGEGTKLSTGDRGAGNGGNPPEYPPFIQGLLAKLPQAETEWSLEGRKKWLQTASNIFDLMYQTAADDTGELNITVKKDSAN
jgi:hypothetical protein